MGSTHTNMVPSKLQFFSLFLLSQSYASLGTSLTGKDVTVTTVINAPFMMLKPDHTNRIGNDKYEGFLMDLLTIVSKYMKFKSFSVSTAPDGKYGRYDNTTNSWNGMIGEVMKGTVDMAMADISITSYREKAVDFTVPFMHVGIGILYKKPSWIKQWRAPISSVHDLANQNSVKYGTVRGGSTNHFFKNSDYDIYQRIWEAMEAMEEDEPVYTASNLEGVQKVLDSDGDYAFFMESASLKYHMSRHCQLTQVGGILSHKGYGAVLPQGSPYREELNIALLELQEDGTLFQLVKKWWNQDECLLQEDNGFIQSMWNWLSVV